VIAPPRHEKQGRPPGKALLSMALGVKMTASTGGAAARRYEPVLRLRSVV
jgi:hypothetical protein